MRYFPAHQRLWIVGPLRIVVGVPFMVINAAFNATCATLFLRQPD